MRVRLPNPPISIMNFHLGIGIAADLAAAIGHVLLGVELPARPAATATADIPPASSIRDNMMRPACAFPYGHLTLLVSQNRESKFAIANLP